MLLNDFLKYVLPDVPGCPSAVAKQKLLEAATDFLTRSQAWNEVQYAQRVQPDQQEYWLDAPSGARCIDVLDVYTVAGHLIPVTLGQLAQVMPDWQTAEGSTPTYYTRAFDFETLRVFPKPTQPGSETLTVHAVYTLTDRSATIPDVIAQRYAEPIAHGTKFRLMTMPRAQWQDLKLAEYHRSEFESGVSMALITATHGKTAGSARVQPRRFGQ